MISPEKSRAARAWLEWSRADLSARSGVSAPAITEFEGGRSQPGSETLKKLETAFTAAGILFTENGVEYRRDRIVWIADYLALLDDILLSGCREALFMNADDAKSSAAVREREEALAAAGIALRFLTPAAGKSGRVGSWRRAAIPGFQDVRIIYGGRVAFWTPGEILLVINDYLAGDYERQFEELWQNAEKI